MNLHRHNLLKTIPGWEELCNTSDKKQETIAHKLVKWMDNMKKLPNKRSKDEEERKFGSWISGMKQAKKDFIANGGVQGDRTRTPGFRIWYPEVEKILTDAGYKGVFDCENPKKDAIDMAH